MCVVYKYSKCTWTPLKDYKDSMQGSNRDTMIAVWWEISDDLQMSLCSARSIGHPKEKQIVILEGRGRIRSTANGSSCYLTVTSNSGKYCELTRVQPNPSWMAKVSRKVGEHKSVFSCTYSTAGIDWGQICHCQWACVHYTFTPSLQHISSYLFHSRLVGL